MPTILIVDDSNLDREFASRTFQKAPDWEQISARNAEEALEALEAHEVDVLLTDLQMPGTSGIELLESVRTAHPGIPVIVMTAQGSEETAVAALESGAASYIPKRHLKRDGVDIARQVYEVSYESARDNEVRQCITRTVTHLELPSQRSLVSITARHLQRMFQDATGAPEGDRIRLGVVLEEVIANAIVHGNLGVGSELRGVDDDTYEALIKERSRQPPYCDRVVRIKVTLSRDEVEFVVSDEGEGFDHSKLPDPTDPENLVRASGRGILLMRTFMDEVAFNDRGNETRLRKIVRETEQPVGEPAAS